MKEKTSRVIVGSEIIGWYLVTISLKMVITIREETRGSNGEVKTLHIRGELLEFLWSFS